ncbi:MULTISPECIES: hypothetical protein [unclassified Pseudoalteromonas]|nr:MULTISPECIES: hypothetical protein [unclassified Pseudoalteromonas]
MSSLSVNSTASKAETLYNHPVETLYNHPVETLYNHPVETKRIQNTIWF